MKVYILQILKNGVWISSGETSENYLDLVKKQSEIVNSRIILQNLDLQKQKRGQGCCSRYS
jgi:hypothetical protein